jgi:adenylate cyclase
MANASRTFYSNHRFELTGCILLLMLGGLSLHYDLTAGFDRQVLDTEFQLARKWTPHAALDDPVIVGIDEEFLDSVDEPLTLIHPYLGRFLSAVAQSEPKVLALDLALPEKRFETLASTSRPGLDYHKALLTGLLQATQHTTVIVAKVWDHPNSRFQNIQVDYSHVLETQGSSPQPHASVLFRWDADGVVRRYPGAGIQPAGISKTFTSEIGTALGKQGDWSGLINYRLGGQFNYIPLQTVLKLDAAGDRAALAQLFRGKVVLLGSVLKETDLLELPVPLAAWDSANPHVPGVLAHAQILRSMQGPGLIQNVPAPVLWGLTGLFALLWFGQSVVRKLVIFGVAATGLFAVGYWLLMLGYWLPPGPMLLVGLTAGGARSIREAWTHFRQKQWLSRTFSGYVSPAVMQEIVSGGVDASKEGRKLPVCVLFSDIRGFTTLSESLPAQEVVALLNRYFARMTAAVHRHGGTVDKFIGDGMMAIFGAPNVLPAAERNAMAAAHDMLAALDGLNRELATEGRAPLVIGIGLHSGEAVIGHIGSPDRHEYTAIGDTVNTAARLESLCKELGYPIVCSDQVAAALESPELLVNLGEKQLKGRHSSVVVHGLKS